MNTRKPAIGFIFVTLFLDVLGIGLIIPILPKLIESLQAAMSPPRRTPSARWPHSTP